MVLRLFVGGAGALDAQCWGGMLARRAAGVAAIEDLLGGSKIETVHPALHSYVSESGPLLVQLPADPLDAVRKLKASGVDLSDGSQDVALIGYEGLAAYLARLLVDGRYGSDSRSDWMDRAEALRAELEGMPGVFLVASEVSTARPEQLLAALSLRFDLKMEVERTAKSVEPGYLSLASLLNARLGAGPDAAQIERRLASHALVAPSSVDDPASALEALSAWFADRARERQLLVAREREAREEAERLAARLSGSTTGPRRNDHAGADVVDASEVGVSPLAEGVPEEASDSGGEVERGGMRGRSVARRAAGRAYQMSPGFLKAWLRKIASRFRLRRDMKIIEQSDLFDSLWYASRYGDVRQEDALVHFSVHGWKEMRAPGPLFCCAQYVERYPDVAVSGLNPLIHYEVTGRAEGRHAFPVYGEER